MIGPQFYRSYKPSSSSQPRTGKPHTRLNNDEFAIVRHHARLLREENWDKAKEIEAANPDLADDFKKNNQNPYREAAQ